MNPVVVELDACAPGSAADGVSLRTTLDASAGCPEVVQRVADVSPGAGLSGVAEAGGELWFVRSGGGRLSFGAERPGTEGGVPVELEPGVGAHLAGGLEYRLETGSGGTEVVVAVLPARPAATTGGGARPARPPVVARLEDCEVERTGDRLFRVLVGPGRGCEAATQFVGEIPPGRAPAHSHSYDEVVFVLSGRGVLHLDGGDRPLRPGTCVYLPPGTRHCLENTGAGTLEVLGVFQPGGSPAAKQGADA